MTVRQALNTLQLFEFFAERRGPASAAEIAAALGWPRSSTFKLVATLEGAGYLYEPRARGGVYPSPRWLELAARTAEADPLPPEVHRLTRAIAEETGETTAVSAPAGVNAIFLDVVESRQPVRYFARVGDRVPIHASSAGRALLAQMSPAERRALYGKIDFVAHSPTTPESPDAVEAALREAEARGYHQSNAEYTPDLAGVALPLPLARHLAIVVVGPVSRCLDRRPELADIVKNHIRTLAPR